MGPQTVPGAAQALLDAAASRGVHDVQDTSAVAVTALPNDLPGPADGNSPVTQRVSFACGPTLVGEARLQLLGPHQLRNCEAALAVLHSMHIGPPCELRRQLAGNPNWNITAGAIAQGISAATLPGRFQVLPPPQQGPPRPLVVVDGAHSPAAARALVDTLRHLGWHSKRRPLVLVLAAAADKDLRGMAQHLAELAPELCIATTVPVAGARVRAAASGDIAAAWGAACAAAGAPAGRVEQQAELAAALRRACDVAGPQGLVCVTGSLHLAFQAARLLHRY
jgi:folylpolyglutamate synthase/dihydropteroate synthase